MAKLPFVANNGQVTDTTARVVVYSVTSGSVTMNWNGGGDETITMSGVGTDGAGAPNDSGGGGTPGIYVGVYDATGLSADTRYTWTLTRGSDVRTGSTRTNPTSNFTVFFTTCDGPADYCSNEGCYPYMRSQIESGPLPVHAIINIEDHGYTDGGILVDDTGPGGTGQYSQLAQDTGLAYSRAIAYAAYLGLHEAGTFALSGYDYVDKFNDTDRTFCWENVPQYRSVGDHECRNNPEEGSPAPTAQLLSTSIATWRSVIGKVNDPIGATYLSWVKRLGPLEIIAYDRLGGLTGTYKVFDRNTWTVTDNGGSPPTGQWLSNAQITELLDEVDTSSPFKIVAASCGSKAMMAGADILADQVANPGYGIPAYGAQEPIHDYTLVSGDSEWLRLMSEKPNGICAKAKSYGGVVLTPHGDTHRPYVYYHYYPESSTHAMIDMLELSTGTVNGMVMHLLSPLFYEGYSYDGITIDWLAPRTIQNLIDSPFLGYSTLLQMDVYQEESPMRIEWKILECAIGETYHPEPIVLKSGTILQGASTTGDNHYRKGWM